MKAYEIEYSDNITNKNIKILLICKDAFELGRYLIRQFFSESNTLKNIVEIDTENSTYIYSMSDIEIKDIIIKDPCRRKQIVFNQK